MTQEFLRLDNLLIAQGKFRFDTIDQVLCLEVVMENDIAGRISAVGMGGLGNISPFFFLLQGSILARDVDFDALANITNDFYGSNLKNLCITASYRPVRDLGKWKANSLTVSASNMTELLQWNEL
ncbi:AAA-lid-3 domain-containing protein [Abeliophyllum distichum]|uniref:AAA-lid-3 domain-containing protein n=1 Tax=Abeliophyllum distichum TaxID=126358 RepID=A0ABD1VF42_9LAMI